MTPLKGNRFKLTEEAKERMAPLKLRSHEGVVVGGTLQVLRVVFDGYAMGTVYTVDSEDAEIQP